MIQVFTPNPNIAYVGGWCEGYVEGTAGQATIPTAKNPRTSGVWGNAVSAVNKGETGAWDMNYNGGNHPGELPPRGVRVPVFFTLGSTKAGHVALSLEDGRVASSTQPGLNPTGYIHKSLDDLVAVYAKYNSGCKYLGWSEYIGKQRVVMKGNDMIPDADHVNALFQAFIGRNAGDGELKNFIGSSYNTAVEQLNASPERKTLLARLALGNKAANDNWQGQIEGLIRQLQAMPQDTSEAEKKLAAIKAALGIK